MYAVENPPIPDRHSYEISIRVIELNEAEKLMTSSFLNGSLPPPIITNSSESEATWSAVGDMVVARVTQTNDCKGVVVVVDVVDVDAKQKESERHG